jgi:hypothetical protein
MAIDLMLDLNHLEVRQTGFDWLFALKGRLEVPLNRISSVDVLRRTEVPPTPGTWLRAPGTHIPGVIRYGSYGREPHREFWAVYRQRYVLVIGVDGWDYRRLVLGVKDAPLHAGEIRTAAEVHHPLSG